MSKKADIIKGLRELAKTAISEIQDIPESLFDAVRDYECEGESSNGAIKLKLVVTLPDDEPNDQDQTRQSDNQLLKWKTHEK